MLRALNSKHLVKQNGTPPPVEGRRAVRWRSAWLLSFTASRARVPCLTLARSDLPCTAASDSLSFQLPEHHPALSLFRYSRSRAAL